MISPYKPLNNYISQSYLKKNDFFNSNKEIFDPTKLKSEYLKGSSSMLANTHANNYSFTRDVNTHELLILLYIERYPEEHLF